MFVKTEVHSADEVYINKVKNIHNEILSHYNAVDNICRLCGDRFKNHDELSTKQLNYNKQICFKCVRLQSYLDLL